MQSHGTDLLHLPEEPLTCGILNIALIPRRRTIECAIRAPHVRKMARLTLLSGLSAKKVT